MTAQVMYAMDGINNNRKRRAHGQAIALERRVSARLYASIPTAINANGALVDFP